jgi:hypothetical protein
MTAGVLQDNAQDSQEGENCLLCELSTKVDSGPFDRSFRAPTGNGASIGHSLRRICSEGYMTGIYHIEIELLLNESAATQALGLARDIYLQPGGARTVESGIEREMSADEFVDDVEQALLELVEGNLLRLPGIVIGHENCTQLPEVDAARFSRIGED